MAFSRRDFLKFSAALTASSLIRPGLKINPTKLSTNPNAKNILFIVFDCFSGKNINFYGYPRETMPNLTRLLDRATVYHNHYASGNFTTPGTASLLTGRHVWEHLALKNPSYVQNGLGSKNIFSFFDDYHTIAYSHNYMADIILSQFEREITHHEFYRTQLLEYKLTNSSQWFDKLFHNDPDTVQLIRTRMEDTSLDGYLYALLFPSLLGNTSYEIPPEIAAQFPQGVPRANNKRDAYILEDAIQWTMDQASTLPRPFLGYFHFFPPHPPLNNRVDFTDTFLDDGYSHLNKPHHPTVLPAKWQSYKAETKMLRQYDEFILYTDSEFARLFTYLDQQGILENTIVVFTSDHGQMMERRVTGHMLPYLYDPVVKVPLVIFEPGQTTRRDIYSPTSAVDILPTLLQYTGHEIPADLPGQILPPFSGSGSADDRPVYSFYGRESASRSHLDIATFAMRRNEYKVIQSFGYSHAPKNLVRSIEYDIPLSGIDPYYEVYNLEEDPEEMNNLALNPPSEVQALINEAEQFYFDNIEYQQ